MAVCRSGLVAVGLPSTFTCFACN